MAGHVLAHLRRITVERVLTGEASDGMLRYLEGQRYLVRYIERKSTGEHPRAVRQHGQPQQDPIRHPPSRRRTAIRSPRAPSLASIAAKA